MMDIILDLKKTVHQNANLYFEKAKKAKKKIEGATAALKKSEKQLSELSVPKKNEEKVEPRKVAWFEKFRWFYTSNGLLAIGGRDATTNEIIIKKHTDKNDFVFHTDMAGSPFFVLKTDNTDVQKEILEEVAQVTACYSRGWKKGFGSIAVFYVKPEQVTKQANPGEHLAKGSFMVRGKTTYLHPTLELTIGVKDGRTIIGTRLSVRNQTKTYVKVTPGQQKSSDAAKLILKLGATDKDEVIRMLPPGGVKIHKS